MTEPRRISQHERITEDLRARITGGDWPPGHQLPVETELAASFGVSRMTMNKVLTRLSQEGYLIRRKKRGTVVAQPRVQTAVMEIADLEEEVRLLGQEHRFDLTERALRPLSAAEAADTEASPGQPVLWLQGLHRADGVVFCRESRLINPAQAPGVLAADFTAQAPGAWLLRTVPWSRAQHRIRAINAPAALAAELGLEPGEACLEILRLTRIEACWVTWARLVYPGHAHQLVAEFEPRALPEAGRDSA